MSPCVCDVGTVLRESGGGQRRGRDQGREACGRPGGRPGRGPAPESEHADGGPDACRGGATIPRHKLGPVQASLAQIFWKCCAAVLFFGKGPRSPFCIPPRTPCPPKADHSGEFSSSDPFPGFLALRGFSTFHFVGEGNICNCLGWHLLGTDG